MLLIEAGEVTEVLVADFYGGVSSRAQQASQEKRIQEGEKKCGYIGKSWLDFDNFCCIKLSFMAKAVHEVEVCLFDLDFFLLSCTPIANVVFDPKGCLEKFFHA